MKTVLSFRRFACLSLALGTLVVAGCGSDDQSTEGAGATPGKDASSTNDGSGANDAQRTGDADASVDTGKGGADASRDGAGGTDANGTEAATAADGSDAPHDAVTNDANGADASNDAPTSEVGTDAAPDVGSDSAPEVDAATDVSPADGANDAENVDASPGSDGDTDAGSEASADAGAEQNPGSDAATDVATETGSDGPIGVCGDGVIDPGEECDDGDVLPLDGCDATCQYELVTRVTSLSIQGTTAPAFCTPATNNFGTHAVTGTALGQLNPPLQQAVTAGTVNVMMPFYGLDDLTGVNSGAPFSIAILSADLDPQRGAWPAGNPIDWWFLADSTAISGGRATNLIGAAISAGALTASSTGISSLTVALGGVLARLDMRDVQFAATINGTPTPNVPAAPPAVLAPGLTVFQTITGSGAGQGMCGNITVDALAKIPVPSALAVGGGNTTCAECAGSHAYTACAGGPVGPGCNSLLDVIVGGCKVFSCVIAAVNPTQPDVPVGATVAALTPASNNKVPDAQTAGNLDAYSSYWKFDANRAHFTGATP